MEGVPRIPMISFPLRRNADVPSFKPKLQKFILSHYGENPDSFSKEIHELESLRNSALRTKDNPNLLKKYYCQLNFLKSRFPLKEGSPVSITFSWYDLFSEQVHSWSDIDYELSCVVFNMAALLSELSSENPRTTSDDMKNCVKNYLTAAWALEILRSEYYRFTTPDLTGEITGLMSNICLAQAQECVLEKSLIDNKRAQIIAKLATQIVEYYHHCLKIITSVLKLPGKTSDKALATLRKWKKVLDLKVAYYGAINFLYRGQQAEDDQKYGERITFYKASQEKIEAALKIANSMEKSDPVHLTLGFAVDVIVGKSTSAQKDNEFIYHDKVPKLESLEVTKGESVVKPIPLKADDPEISGPDIFSRLVPLDAHKTSSLYSEEKAKLLRSYADKINEKNKNLQSFLLAFQLEHLSIHDEKMKVPQELIDACASMNGRPDAVSKLVKKMGELSGKFHDVQESLKEVGSLLERAKGNEAKELLEEAEKYEKAHTKAQASNEQLREIAVSHVENLRTLMKPLPELIKQIPTLGPLSDKDKTIVSDMKRLAGKIDEMKKQRESLEQKLRESIQNDDITQKLVVTAEEDVESLFQKEMEKHKKITVIIDQNLLAQENIVRALSEINAQYALTRETTMDVLTQRSNFIESLVNSFEAYDDLLQKCQEGVDFYVKLEENINKVLNAAQKLAPVKPKVTNDSSDIGSIRLPTMSRPPGSSGEVKPKLKDYLGGGNIPLSSTPYQPSAPSIHPATYSNLIPQQPQPTNFTFQQPTVNNPTYPYQNHPTTAQIPASYHSQQYSSVPGAHFQDSNINQGLFQNQIQQPLVTPVQPYPYSASSTFYNQSTTPGVGVGMPQQQWNQAGNFQQISHSSAGYSIPQSVVASTSNINYPYSASGPSPQGPSNVYEPSPLPSTDSQGNTGIQSIFSSYQGTKYPEVISRANYHS